MKQENTTAKNIVIKVQNLSKCYQIYNRPIDRLKQSLFRKRKKFFREFWALRDVSFEIQKNETVGIIGSNGSGKSTILQILCNILKPTHGDLYVRGRIAALLELGAGFNPEFTGRENVRISATILGLTESELEGRFHSILEFADIGEFIDQPVKTYSSGMYIRLAFATAVHVSPDILIIDEALAVGDARFKFKCMDKIRGFCNNGTVLFVSHDMTAVKELCSRVIWIESGRIQMDDKPKYVVEKYLEYMYDENSNQKPVLKPKKLKKEISEAQKIELEDFMLISEKVRQFGDKSAAVRAVKISTGDRHKGVAYSGEKCDIEIIVDAHEDIANPLIGYMIRDRLGRDIVADNTALLKKQIPPLKEGRRYLFTFQIDQWPNILEGEYSLAVAVADGTLNNHAQCHWLQDAFVFKSIPARRPGAILSILNTDVGVTQIEK